MVIPRDFSTRMMTFFTTDGDHATLTYYNNEKKNALAPKITGQEPTPWQHRSTKCSPKR